jgi:hypothetical protein
MLEIEKLRDEQQVLEEIIGSWREVESRYDWKIRTNIPALASRFG